jgi:hypothetical protein
VVLDHPWRPIGQSQLCCFLAGSIYASFWDFGFLRICTKFNHQSFLESGCLDNLTPGISPIVCWNPLSSNLSRFCGPLNLQHFCGHWDSDLSFKLWLAPKSRYNVYGDIHIRFRSTRPASHLWLKMIRASCNKLPPKGAWPQLKLRL